MLIGTNFTRKLIKEYIAAKRERTESKGVHFLLSKKGVAE